MIDSFVDVCNDWSLIVVYIYIYDATTIIIMANTGEEKVVLVHFSSSLVRSWLDSSILPLSDLWKEL